MNLSLTFIIALKALRVNALRSVLTMLGVIIGVAAVIALVSIGTGAQDKIVGQIEALGSNLLIITNASSRNSGARMGAGSKISLTIKDVEAIANEKQLISEASPTLHTKGQVISGNFNWSTDITGAYKNFFIARDWSIAQGRMFNEIENKSSAKIGILGKTVVDNISPNSNPLGTIIRINRVPIKVIGVLESKGQSADGKDQDDIIIIPFQTVQKRILGSNKRARPNMVHVIWVKVIDSSVMNKAESRIKEILRKQHKIRQGKEDDFKIHNLEEIRDTVSQSIGIFTLLLGAVASIALVVGGIGIMNIMLVSVTERTKEIGLRMALGAKRKNILMQFIVESITLSLIGGLIGIIFGIIVSYLISKAAGWPTTIEVSSIVIAFFFSAAIGIIFGAYPARKASLLDPIDALRFE
ncbi:MAG: multidrug ABC transporter substrate-binding protein [Rhodospirillaceae bacterium]|nr:multidrug ABC transporter substrate-binding protein [Rhodospirillaceae bacterium]